MSSTLTAPSLSDFVTEVERRGGETEIQGKYGDPAILGVIDESGDGLCLLHAQGWRAYGKSHPARWTELSYLCGTEDGQLWAVRVPGTVISVADALLWMTPQAVRDARAAGRRVERQGDVYIVETIRRCDGKVQGEMPARHVWNPETRVLSHPEHGDLRLPHWIRFYPQHAYEMGRSGRRAYAD